MLIASHLRWQAIVARAIAVLAIAPGCLFVAQVGASADVSVNTPSGNIPFSRHVTFSGSGKSAGTAVRIHDGGSYVYCEPAPSDSSTGHWECEANWYGGFGTYTYEVREVDANNYSDILNSDSVTFTVVSVLQISSTSGLTTDGPIVVGGTADQDVDVAASVTRTGVQGFSRVLSCDVAVDGTFTCVDDSGQPLPPGADYKVEVFETYDNDGVTVALANETATFAVTASAPTLSVPTLPTPTLPTPTPSTPTTPTREDKKDKSTRPDPSPIFSTTPAPTLLEPVTPAASPAPSSLRPPAVVSASPMPAPISRHSNKDHDARLAVSVGLAGVILLGAWRGASRSRLRSNFANANDDALERETEHRGDGGWGDRSISWRFPGHVITDQVGHTYPPRMGHLTPLVARVIADGAYLRSMLGVGWLIPVLSGAALGVAAVLDTDGRPLPPSLPIVVAVLAFSFIDALSGGLALIVYWLGVLISGGLTDSAPPALANSGVTMLAMGLLWMALPLIGCALRPFRRSLHDEGVYAWNRIGDILLPASFCGWIAWKLCQAMPLFAGQPLAIGRHAGAIGLFVAGAVVVRIGLEEVAERGYPNRLRQVEIAGTLPNPSRLAKLSGGLVRVGVLALAGYIFTGLCWEWWLGVGLIGVWELASVFDDLLPKSKMLGIVTAQGLAEILILMVSCTLAVRWATADKYDMELVRAGFVALAVPAAVLGLLQLVSVSREDSRIRWNWPGQFLGLVAFIVLVVLASFGWDY